LAEQLVSQQPALAIEHGHGTFVAGGFNRQNTHLTSQMVVARVI
jgi:hypothetical protein